MPADDIPLKSIGDPHSVITAITSNDTFPEFLGSRSRKYKTIITTFSELVLKAKTSSELLAMIRNPSSFNKDDRMSLLKLFRRCVSTVIDTEAAKKIRIPTKLFVDNYGDSFKDIAILKKQFSPLPESECFALIALLGEYDTRGHQGYELTEIFFSWFEARFCKVLEIEGPRGAGKDIQMNTVFNDFKDDYPCDFIIRDCVTRKCLAVGFARYDSTRGGAQSDDRTGGNNDKVFKASAFMQSKGINFKIIFVADGPGLAHGDTWREACTLDGKLNGQVKVTTLKMADIRITEKWLRS